MLSAASAHVAISESRARWQLTIVGSLRVPIMALGQKLVESGTVDAPDDVFHLSTEELQEAAAAPAVRLQDRVAKRKLEWNMWNDLTPPPFIGRPPAMDGAPPELISVFRRFFGLGVEPSREANVINGNAASGGVVTAEARVITDLSEADRFQPGEVLVCAITAPPWTPLFSIASAVVTDTGGLLSHSAICAREFAIPCVVGAANATHLIRDGDIVTVDGDRGTVTIRR